ncbi:hypothetical protein PAMP_001423 [Pampus punctatissimus]
MFRCIKWEQRNTRRNKVRKHRISRVGDTPAAQDQDCGKRSRESRKQTTFSKAHV